MKHTPGPWKLGMYFSQMCIERALNEQLIVVFGQDAPRQEDRANARLMAAAPDLLEACKAALTTFESWRNGNVFPEEIAALHAAIARAEGDPLPQEEAPCPTSPHSPSV